MDQSLAARLGEVEEAYRAVEADLADPDVIAVPARLAELGKRHSELAPIVQLLDRWRRATTDRDEALELAAADPEMSVELRRMADERAKDAELLEAELRKAMVPKDPNDDKDVIVEVRAAAGGDEAAIWAGDLLRMYDKYADSHGFRLEPLETSPSEAGGYNRVTFAVKGRGAYSRFKYEAGVHRVQRVPRTESQGRVHTSTATVAVLPEADEVEVVIDPSEVKVDVFRSQGPGGQSVNTTDSAVRLTHAPSGLVVSVQDEKSQLQNKEKAFRILRARLLAIRQAEHDAEVAGARRSQVGTGERSEKIRTYNYKDNRVTDHRIGLTLKRLDSVLEGDLDQLVDALTSDDQAERLASG
ncbi:MAG TPA: peptide chain release factor 1 [Acidimicrobiia bacterium]|nr:peptide chain release factor 1 [Acidimicrobiia bacterium]